MGSSDPSTLGIMLSFLVASLVPFCLCAQAQTQREGRMLLSFKEINGNATFECSPSGPCVPCQYSEKSEVKYRCSETGYRIPLKCVQIEEALKEVNSKKSPKSRSNLETDASSTHHNLYPALQEINKLATSLRHFKLRRLLDVSSASEGGKPNYITFRSCVPATNEDRLTVLGFEGIMVCLLLATSPVIYLRRKRTIAMLGLGVPVRIPTNSRF